MMDDGKDCEIVPELIAKQDARVENQSGVLGQMTNEPYLVQIIAFM